MNFDFPAAVPEIPVESIDVASTYYTKVLGFTFDWGDEAGGIAGLSRGQCRLFLTNSWFRSARKNAGPVIVWLNVTSKQEVDALHAEWSQKEARIVAPPEDKPWLLREFTAADSDGNFFRVFYDFRAEGGAQHQSQ